MITTDILVKTGPQADRLVEIAKQYWNYVATKTETPTVWQVDMPDVFSLEDPAQTTGTSERDHEYLAALDAIKVRPKRAIIKRLAGGTSRNKSLIEIDFKTDLRCTLVKKVTMSSGQPIKAEYYEELNAQGEYFTLVAQIDFSFERDALGFVTKKTALLQWYNEDGTLAPDTKNLGRAFHPVYDAVQVIEEGLVRRRNLIDELKVRVLGFMQETMSETNTLEEIYSAALTFMLSHKAQVDAFVESGDETDLVNNISLDTTSWLDNAITVGGNPTTIKQFIVDTLSGGF